MQFYSNGFEYDHLSGDFIFHAISSRTSSLLDRLSAEAPFSPSVIDMMEPSMSPCPVLPVLPPPPCIGMVNDVTLLTDVCPIHHEIPTLETAYRTQCNHFFDRDAIWMWWKIKGKKECPSCRAIEPPCLCISCK